MDQFRDTDNDLADARLVDKLEDEISRLKATIARTKHEAAKHAGDFAARVFELAEAERTIVRQEDKIYELGVDIVDLKEAQKGGG